MCTNFSFFNIEMAAEQKSSMAHDCKMCRRHAREDGKIPHIAPFPAMLQIGTKPPLGQSTTIFDYNVKYPYYHRKFPKKNVEHQCRRSMRWRESPCINL